MRIIIACLFATILATEVMADSRPTLSSSKRMRDERGQAIICVGGPEYKTIDAVAEALNEKILEFTAGTPRIEVYPHVAHGTDFNLCAQVVKD